MTIDEIILLLNCQILQVTLESVTYSTYVITGFNHLFILVCFKHLVLAKLIDINLVHILLKYVIEHLKISTYSKL